MNLTRREALRGTTATVAAIAAAGAVAGAAVPAATGSDARLDELYRVWREAEDNFNKASDTWFGSEIMFEGIEVEGPDGKVHTSKAESDLKSIFPTPFAVRDFSDADFGDLMIAARGEPTNEKEAAMSEIWSRYPDVHAEAREAALERLEEAERAHQQSPGVQAEKQAEAAWSAAADRTAAVLGTIADTPAVSLHGVLTKLRIWDEDGMEAGTPAAAVWDSAVADLLRLAREVPS